MERTRHSRESARSLKQNGLVAELFPQVSSFERFFDKVSEAGLEIEERWLIAANTISMAAPLLEGIPATRLKELVVNALRHHKMLSATERMALAALSWLS